MFILTESYVYVSYAALRELHGSLQAVEKKSFDVYRVGCDVMRGPADNGHYCHSVRHTGVCFVKLNAGGYGGRIGVKPGWFPGA